MVTERQHIGELSSKDGSTNFSLFRGINPDSINSLIAYSKEQDEAVAKFTSDLKRFADIDAVQRWLQKGRSVYSLEQKIVQAFTGIIWFGSESMPYSNQILPNIDPLEFGITFAIRLYEAARGKGLATPFMRETFTHFMDSEDYKSMPNKNFWLEVSDDNIAAVSAYKKIGFENSSAPDEQNKILMTFRGIRI